MGGLTFKNGRRKGLIVYKNDVQGSNKRAVTGKRREKEMGASMLEVWGQKRGKKHHSARDVVELQTWCRH